MVETPHDCKGCHAYNTKAPMCVFLKDYLIGTNNDYPELLSFYERCPCRRCLLIMMCSQVCESKTVLNKIYIKHFSLEEVHKRMCNEPTTM